MVYEAEPAQLQFSDVRIKKILEMAEVVGLAASVLTLLAAADQVAKGLDKLASIKEAPAAVLALNNEVSEIRLILCEAQPLLQQYQGTVASTVTEDRSLQVTIDRAKERLTDLQSIVGTRLLRRMGTRDRFGWLYEQDKVQKALCDVRAAREKVTTMLGVVTA